MSSFQTCLSRPPKLSLSVSAMFKNSLWYEHQYTWQKESAVFIRENHFPLANKTFVILRSTYWNRTKIGFPVVSRSNRYETITITFLAWRRHRRRSEQFFPYWRLELLKPKILSLSYILICKTHFNILQKKEVWPENSGTFSEASKWDLKVWPQSHLT